MASHVSDYVINYYGAIMHVDTSSFGIAIKADDIPLIREQYDALCASIYKEHSHHLEEVNRHFNRMRIHVNSHFTEKGLNLPYVFFQDQHVEDE